MKMRKKATIFIFGGVLGGIIGGGGVAAGRLQILSIILTNESMKEVSMQEVHALVDSQIVLLLLLSVPTHLAALARNASSNAFSQMFADYSGGVAYDTD